MLGSHDRRGQMRTRWFERCPGALSNTIAGLIKAHNQDGKAKETTYEHQPPVGKARH